MVSKNNDFPFLSLPRPRFSRIISLNLHASASRVALMCGSARWSSSATPGELSPRFR